MLFFFGAFSNFFVYQTFLTGIYNYRTHELINMKTVPLPGKLFLSSLVSFTMCKYLYVDHIYDEKMY